MNPYLEYRRFLSAGFFYFKVEVSLSVSSPDLFKETYQIFLFFVNFQCTGWWSRFKKVVDVFLTSDRATWHVSRMSRVWWRIFQSKTSFRTRWWIQQKNVGRIVFLSGPVPTVPRTESICINCPHLCFTFKHDWRHTSILSYLVQPLNLLVFEKNCQSISSFLKHCLRSYIIKTELWSTKMITYNAKSLCSAGRWKYCPKL